jgi:carboxypeptidase PM20D1
MGFWQRLVMANLWLLAPIVEGTLAEAPASNALIRTTIAPTLLASGDRSNVLPPRASATVNVRLLPGDTIEEVVERLRRVVDDPRVAIAVEPDAVAASRISPIDDPIFRDLAVTIREVDERVIVAPGLMLGMTDSKHYAGLTDRVYRFNPMRLARSDLQRLHGVDERIAVAELRDAVAFYVRLMMRFAR